MLRSWLGVHPWRLALGLIALATLGSVFLGRAWVSRTLTISTATPDVLESPTPLGMLMPVVAAAGIAVGCTGPRVRLPEPTRVRVGRLAWVAALTATACVALLVTRAAPGAVVRGVLILTALALIPVVLRLPMVAWVPPVVYLMASVYFGGQSGGRWAWWAQAFNPDAEPQDVIVAAGIWAAVAGAYALRPPVARF